MGQFKTYSETITVSTKGNNDIIDVSAQIAAVVEKSAVREGVACVSVPHTTCAITAMEFEPGTIADLKEFLDAWVPADGRYRHNIVNHDTNGHSHLRSSLLGPSMQLPVSNAGLLLGTWQTPVLIDCDDRPRRRQIVVTILGTT
jgi:secondary thiamine-phosphate synthase enzyme